MKPRERYLAAAGRLPVDRPPVDLMGTACGLSDGVFQRLKNLLGVASEDRMFRVGENVKLYNDQILEALHVDARRVWMKQTRAMRENAGKEEFIDEWGLQYRRCGMHIQRVNSPLQGATTGDLKNYSWPDMTDSQRVEGLEARAKRLREDSESAIIGRSPTPGFFELGCWLRGMEQYLMDLLLDPGFIGALNEILVDLQIQLYGRYLDACGEYLDVIETADDYGTNAGPVVSPKVFRQHLKPWRMKLNAFIKSKAPHLRIFLHSCGNVHEFIPDFIEAGVDILNPVQRVPGMEPELLAREYGKDICFHGGIDTIGAMRGGPQDVLAEWKRVREGFGETTGWIMAPANHLQDDVPEANVQLLYEKATSTSNDKA